MNFCRFPPERLLAGALPAREPSRGTFESTRRRGGRRIAGRKKPNLPTRPPGAVSRAFWASERVGTAPRPRRSSGTKVHPRAPPAVGRGRPHVGAHRRRPFPPAPRVFPGERGHELRLPVARDPGDAHHFAPSHLERGRLRAVVPNGSSGCSDRFANLQRDVPGCGGARDMRAGSAPIIRRARLALVSLRGSTSPVTLPPRRTVRGVQSARISSSLWLM